MQSPDAVGVLFATMTNSLDIISYLWLSDHEHGGGMECENQHLTKNEDKSSKIHLYKSK